jgi:hypothetical protein
MATSKSKPAKKPAPPERPATRRDPDEPPAPEKKEAPRKKVAVATPKRMTYSVMLLEGATLTRKGTIFVAGRPVPVDEATYRIYEFNGRFRCSETEGG